MSDKLINCTYAGSKYILKKSNFVIWYTYQSAPLFSTFEKC